MAIDLKAFSYDSAAIKAAQDTKARGVLVDAVRGLVDADRRHAEAARALSDAAGALAGVVGLYMHGDMLPRPPWRLGDHVVHMDGADPLGFRVVKITEIGVPAGRPREGV